MMTSTADDAADDASTADDATDDAADDASTADDATDDASSFKSCNEFLPQNNSFPLKTQ